VFFAEVTEAETAPLAFVIVAACFVLALVGTARSLRANSSKSTRQPSDRPLWISSPGRPESGSCALSAGAELTSAGVVQPFSGRPEDHLAAAVEVSTSGTRLKRTSTTVDLWVNNELLQPGRSIELTAEDRIVLDGRVSTTEFLVTSERPS
jgi:hypothetical protein